MKYRILYCFYKFCIKRQQNKNMTMMIRESYSTNLSKIRIKSSNKYFYEYERFRLLRYRGLGANVHVARSHVLIVKKENSVRVTLNFEELDEVSILPSVGWVRP